MLKTFSSKRARARGSFLQRKCACGGTPGPTGECDECRKKRAKGMLQRKASQPAEVPPIVHEVLRAPGRPLDPEARAFMEPRFGHDFSQVEPNSEAKVKPAAGESQSGGERFEHVTQPSFVARWPGPKLRTPASGLSDGKRPSKSFWPSRSNLEVSEAPPIVHEILRSPGQPLDSEVRASMEKRFAGSIEQPIGRLGLDPEAEAQQMENSRSAGPKAEVYEQEPQVYAHDFNQVRIHVGERPAQSARSVNALAYTVGHHVVFGSGLYSPHTQSGRGLLAHELTHVVQQTGGNRGNAGVVQRQEAPPASQSDAPTIESETKPEPKRPLIPIPVFDELDPIISVPDVPGIPPLMKGQSLKLSDVKKALELLHPPRKGSQDCGPPFIGFEKATSGEFKGLCCRGSMRSRENCCHWKQIAVFDNKCCTGMNIIVDGRCVAVRPAPPAPFPRPVPAPRPEIRDLPDRASPSNTALA